MAFNVRVFEYRGMTQVPHLDRQHTTDTVFVDTEPYENRQILTTNGATPVSSIAQTGGQTRYVRVEVPDGQAIRYEVNPPNRTGGVVNASTNSPILSGINRFEFYSGWSLSIIDASGT